MIAQTPVQIALTFFGGIAVAQSLFLFVYFFWRGRKDKRFVWAGVFFAALGLRIFKSIFSHILIDYSFWGSMLGLLGLALAGPAIFHFCRSLLRTEKTRVFVLHIIIPVVAVAALAITRPDRPVITWAYRIATAQFIGYGLAAYLQWQTSAYRHHKLPIHLFTVALIFAAVFIIQLVFSNALVYTVGTTIASSAFYLSTFYLMLISKETLKDKEPVVLSESRIADVKNKLATLLSEKQAYRTKGLTVQILAAELDVPAYVLSKIINHHMGTTFNNLVNVYRIREVKQLLSDSANTDKVEHLAKQVGFSGVSSMYQFFKRETGMTPEEFRRQAR